MEERKIMADIRKQAIAILPLSQEMNLKLAYNTNWYVPVKRIWGKKEVERYLFRLYTHEREEWFECGPKLAGEIVEEIAAVVSQNNVNVAKLKDIDISIVNGVEGRKILVNVNNLPMLGKVVRSWHGVKKFFGAAGYEFQKTPSEEEK